MLDGHLNEVGRRGNRVLCGWQRRNERGEGIIFFQFMPFHSFPIFIREYNCRINWREPVTFQKILAEKTNLETWALIEGKRVVSNGHVL
jgi:hypothetical protein